MIPLSVPEIKGNEWKYIKECLDTSFVSSVGGFVNLFEEKFVTYLGAKHSVAVVNGTAALHLALKTLGIGEGDEVIVPSLTFVASANAIIYCGAKPVFADVGQDTWVINADGIEPLITSRTRAILAVHLYGYPADMDKIMEIAKRHGLFVIEDAAQALGSEYNGQKAGTIGDFGCFSFNGNKLITTGGGGMIVSNNSEYAGKAKYLSTQAKDNDETGGFYHHEIGFNYRLPNVLAAMGVAQLENIDEYLAIKKENANSYNELLQALPGISLSMEKPWMKNSTWLYSILINHGEAVRNQLILYLKEKGIESRPFFKPLHTMKPYTSYKTRDMRLTEDVSSTGINLPSSVSLKREEIIYISKTIKDFLER